MKKTLHESLPKGSNEMKIKAFDAYVSVKDKKLWDIEIFWENLMLCLCLMGHIETLYMPLRLFGGILLFRFAAHNYHKRKLEISVNKLLKLKETLNENPKN